VPKICDFGLARLFLDEGSTGMTTTTEHTGTIPYLAPELVSSETTVYPTYPTTASDVYAVGCLGLRVSRVLLPLGYFCLRSIFIISLQFIFLQEPFAHLPNNLRGQIVIRDLKAGKPPATAHPDEGWGSDRAWKFILTLWKPDPSHRPSAFTAAHILRSTDFTIPEEAARRIIDFVALGDTPMDYTISGGEWRRRTLLLCNICLISRAFCGYVMPILYRNIRLYLDRKPKKLLRLIYALESSGRNPLPFTAAGPSGYGRFTRMLLIGVPFGLPQPRQLEIRSNGIRALLNRLTDSRVVLIRGAPDPNPKIVFKSHSLRTLEIQRVSISLLLDQPPVLQALSCLQRLCMRECTLRSPGTHNPSNLCLPNLQDITISGTDKDNFGVITDLLATFSDWTMPRLNSLHISSIWGSPEFIPPFTRFLRVHGVALRYLTLDFHQCPSFADFLPMCHNLRCLSAYLYQEDEFNLLPSNLFYPNLERINLLSGLGLYPKEEIMKFTIFGSSTQMLYLFPKLENATVIFSPHPPVSLSIHPGDNYTIYSDRSDISKIALPSSFFIST
jgi:serine/threonine protein kinase